MAQLEKVDLGAPGTGVGGDSPRSANDRMNRNVDILNSQATLRSAQTGINSSQQLTVMDHVGRRVGINMGSPGWVKLPAAKKCAADQVIHLRNFGLTTVTLAVEDGSGDYIGLDRLQPFETVVMDTNGSTGWWVLYRGRASSGDESVIGNLAVGGALSAAKGFTGDLAISGKLAAINNPNLLFNSTGEFGTAGWGNAFIVAVGGNDIGTFFTNANAITSASVWSGSDSRPIGQNLDMCLSGDIYAGGVVTGNVFARMVFLDSAGAVVAISPSITGDPGKGWAFKSITARSPSNAAKMYVQFGAETVGGSINIQAIGVAWKRIKLEPGTKPSLYSQEASMAYLGGAPAFSGRPTFAGRAPWDSGNLANPMDLDGSQTVTGLKSFTQRIVVTKDPVNGAYANAPVCVVAPTGMASVALASKNGASVVQLRCTSDTSTLEVVNGSSGAYQPITCYSVTQTSDARLKTDVQTITNALEKLRRLRGVYYVMNEVHGVGVIAQEMREVFPEVVEELGVSAEDGTPYLGVNYANMVGPLLQGMLEIDAELQDAMKRIEALELAK
ncbi:tail fiber domain-containing protein [Burkholderia cepacia]|uniref:tail fiber domain-containing protein n=1 Tax=Burkholderia cepacia TaxID=292 RepID=UPI001590F75C|nr:tail fiber domain-containing protein [Burkholderia cepacia]